VVGELPTMERLGIASAADVGIETLAERPEYPTRPGRRAIDEQRAPTHGRAAQSM